MKKLGRKKELTMDDLAAMTQRGFQSVEGRFDDVDKRFDDADKQFESFRHEMNKRFDVVDSRLDRIEFMVSGHDRRLDKLEDQMLIVKALFEKKLSISFPT